MAETVIQLKRSTTTATPSALNIAEPAYSYSSNTLFIGTPDGASVLQIGGYVRDQLLTYSSKHANLAFDQANSAATSDFTQAGFEHANQAFDAANTSQTHANKGFDHANAGFDVANTKFASAGGTVTGDVTIQGGLTVEGTTTTVDSTTVKIADNILTLNSAIDQASAPILDAGIEIDRGSSANVILKYSESDDHWQFSNDGTNFENIGAESAEIYANGAFVQANAAFDHANAGFDAANTNATSATAAQTHADQAFEHANAGFDIANTDVTGVSVSGGAIHLGTANTHASFHLAANGRVLSANSTVIGNLPTSALTSGTLGVARGGTGAATHTTNGVLLGQGASAITTASSSTEGHILTINGSGVPTFSMLEGGTF